MTDDIDNPTEELPASAGEFAEQYPDVWDAYADLGQASAEAGPLDGETKRLVKLALAIGSQSEGAVHSHVRRGLDEGLDPETLKHAAVLAIPTVGFPKAIAALTWIEDVTEG
jgi:alkylhydroperoxidase/carboxymuconolactone decarboxylase family protein YurZ